MGHEADGELAMTAPAEMPGEDDVARALAEALRQKPIPDDVWRGMVESFHHLEGKFPDYANGYSVSTDAFRLARAAQALFAPILAENASLRETLRSNSVWDFPRDIQNLTVKLDAAEARALAAEAALAGERERCAKIAEETGFRTISADIAAAIRAQANNEPGA